jgi:hypothetical protein
MAGQDGVGAMAGQGGVGDTEYLDGGMVYLAD